jgi:DNA-binding NarL/FixJ family response regulator
VVIIGAEASQRSVAFTSAQPHDHRVIRVLVADDHPDVRTSLAQLLDQSPDIEVVAACTDGDEVLPAARATGADVALLDLSMPRRTGLEAAGDLREALPGVRIVIVTGTLDAAAVLQCHQIGVAGYLLKGEDPPDALVDRVRTVAAGGSAWGPAALAVLRATGAIEGPDPADGDWPAFER